MVKLVEVWQKLNKLKIIKSHFQLIILSSLTNAIAAKIFSRKL